MIKSAGVKKINVNYRHILAGLCVALFFVVFTAVASATIYVPDDFVKIQEAVDAASDGDTIIVRNGTYTENVDVRNSHLTVQSENGSDKTIVQAADSNDYVFEVTADYVNISGFTVKGATGTVWSAGIFLGGVDDCNISDNNVTNNGDGIYLGLSSNNNIINNTISNNWCGIHLYLSNNNILTNNILVNDGLLVMDSYQNTVENNTVNSKPLIYLENRSDYVITDAGQIVLVSCDNISIENFDLSDTTVGIELWRTNNSKMINNNCSNNYIGIELDYSNNNIITNTILSNDEWEGISLHSSNSNTLTNNTIKSNGDFGIVLSQSSYNCIYLNNFINNTYNVYSVESTNIWNSTEKITYIYKGKTYENYMGNYWSDYTGSDADEDGIGDSPYSINSDEDKYPLMEPWESYFKPAEEKIFDTGQPANPYPSIFGNHTGTIKPNHTVIATKLYTYSCSGTGGHTEYARIWNSTWNATAIWNGYKGDWHNITFDNPVILIANETYNYTIRTGSYPQIHHTDALLTANGWINCTKFIDANGKEYNDWILAIRLE